MEAGSRDFPLGDILLVTMGRLVSPRGMDGVADILSFMTSEPLHTHQLPRAAEACTPALLAQHPALWSVSDPDEPGPEFDWVQWLSEQAAVHGERLPVTLLPAGSWDRRNPLAELLEMAGPEKAGVIAPADGDGR